MQSRCTTASFVVLQSPNTYTGGLGIGEGGDPLPKVVLEADEAIPFTPVQHRAEGVDPDASTPDGTQTLTGLTGHGHGCASPTRPAN